MDFAGRNPFESDGSPQHFGNIDFGMSADLKTARLSYIDDIGRESLGLVDFNHPDFCRESLGFSTRPLEEEFGRESLGIFNLSQIDIGRESMFLSSTKPMDFLNFGAIQRGRALSAPIKSSQCSPMKMLLHFESMRLNGDEKTTFFNNTDLNNAFIEENATVSVASSRFNSASLNSCRDPSPIYSVNSSKKTQFNEAFLTSKENCSLSNFSLPEVIEEKRDKSFISVGDDDVFLNDLIFIEAESLASRFSNGSFCNNGDIFESLHCTLPPPNLMEISRENSPKEPAKCSSESVFKMIDQKFSVPTSSHLITNDKSNVHEVITLNGSSTSSGSKSKDPHEMLNSLSLIINTAHSTEQQRSEGQLLISSLAEILLSSASTQPSYIANHLDDSGHSSIDNDNLLSLPQYRSYEVDAGSKSVQSEGTSCEGVLDLSMKSKSTPIKVPPPKLANKPRILALERKPTSSSQSKIVGNNRSGPMKAVIPLDGMAKRKSLKVTPNRLEVGYKFKKTSTPIGGNERMKPMAQSTPVGPTSDQNSKSRYSTPENSSRRSTPTKIASRYSISELSKPPSATKTTPTTLKRRSIPTALNVVRSNSGEEFKKPVVVERKLVRSFSSGNKIPAKTDMCRSTDSVLLPKNTSRLSYSRLSLTKGAGKENSSVH